MPSEWLLISTAPKDGTPVLLGHAKWNYACSGWWTGENVRDNRNGGWIDGSTDKYEEYYSMHPTHWMPLPAPPSEGASDAK